MSQSSAKNGVKKGQAIGKYTMVADLGHRAPPTFVAHASTLGGDPELVVVECIDPANAPAEANDSFVKRARRLAQTRHPNVCRIRDVVVTKNTIAVASDFVEGETLAELLALDAAAETKRVALPELLRVLVDVLSGMSAIHLAPELVGGAGKNDPAPFHGAIHPRNIVVGADGSARLIRLVRAPNASSDAAERAIEEPGYAAPELLLGDGTAGTRVDIYSVGVLLWEALSGKRLFAEPTAKEVVARQLAGTLPRATPPADMPWADALVDIAARALEVDPDKRFLSTAELAGSLRLAVQARLAPAARVGNAVMALAKEKIAERRARFTPAPRALKTTKVEAAKIDVPKVDAPKKIAIANPPKITEPKPIVTLPSLSEEDASDLAPVTKRLKVESLNDDDLMLGEDDAIDSKWSSVPPAKKPSMAPPLKKTTIAPPLPTRVDDLKAPPVPRIDPIAIAEPTHTPAPNPIAVPPPPAFVVPPQSNELMAGENLETIAPVVAPTRIEAPGPSVAAMPQADASGTVILAPREDPQRKKRMIIVLGMVAFAALILLVAGIRHFTSSPEIPIAAASASTIPTQDAPTATATPAPTTITTPAPIATPVVTIAATSNSPPVSPPTSDPTPKTTPSQTPHDWASHPIAPAKPAHKKPPRSNYEPEGI